MFPEAVCWYDWLGAAAHMVAAALTVAALFLRCRALPAARALLCAAGLCVGVAVFAGVVNTPDLNPADLLLPALARSLELGAPLLLLALCLPGAGKRTASGPLGKP